MMYKKGYSTKCNLCCTLITAIHEVSKAIGCKVDIRKIRRCSDTGSVAADYLSKGSIYDFHKVVPAARQIPEAIPEPLLRWIEDPVPDRHLGRKILHFMKRYTDLIGYN